MAKTLKEFIDEQNKSDKDVFNELEISKHEYNVLKYINEKSDLSVPSLVNLILHENDRQEIKEDSKDELLIRKYIDENSKITEIGKEYLQSKETKYRISELLNG